MANRKDSTKDALEVIFRKGTQKDLKREVILPEEEFDLFKIQPHGTNTIFLIFSHELGETPLHSMDKGMSVWDGIVNCKLIKERRSEPDYVIQAEIWDGHHKFFCYRLSETQKRLIKKIQILFTSHTNANDCVLSIEELVNASTMKKPVEFKTHNGFVPVLIENLLLFPEKDNNVFIESKECIISYSMRTKEGRMYYDTTYLGQY